MNIQNNQEIYDNNMEFLKKTVAYYSCSILQNVVDNTAQSRMDNFKRILLSLAAIIFLVIGVLATLNASNDINFLDTNNNGGNIMVAGFAFVLTCLLAGSAASAQICSPYYLKQVRQQC